MATQAAHSPATRATDPSRPWRGTSPVVLLPLCVLALPLAFGLGAWQSWRLVEAEGTALARSQVRLVKEHAEKLLSRQVTALRQAEGWLASRRPEQIDSNETHRYLRTLTDFDDDIASMWVVGLDGFTRASTFVFPNPRVDVRDRDYVAAHREGRAWYITPVLHGRHDKRLLFGVTHLVPIGDEAKVIVTATAYPDYFSTFWSTLGLRPGTAVVLLRDDGPILARYPPLPGDPAAWRLPDDLLARLGADSAGVIPRAAGQDGVERVWAYERLATLPVVALYGQSTASLASAWRGHLLRYAACGVPALAAVIGFGAVAARQTRELRRVNAHLEELVQARTAELRRSEERFRVAQDLSLDGFTILRAVRDAEGRIVDFAWEYANPAAARLLHASVEELVGARLLERLPGNRAASDLFERYVQVVETGRPHDYELFYDSEGIRGWFRNMTVKLGDGVAVSFADVTTRKELEAEREAALERKETLLREMNHRIKNSLGLVASLLELQARGQAERASQIELKEAAARVLTVAQLHEQLYKTDRVEMVEFGTYLERLASHLASSLARPGATRRIAVDAEPVVLPTDRVIPLALIVNELVTNAFKYAYPEDAPGAEVRVGLRTVSDGWVEVVVEDGGVGISGDFDPATSPGLGMRLVTGLVRQLDGRLSIENAAPGARFVVRVQPGGTLASAGA